MGFHLSFHDGGSEQQGSKYDGDSEHIIYIIGNSRASLNDDDDSRGAWGQVNMMIAVISRGASKDDDDNDDDSEEHGGK